MATVDQLISRIRFELGQLGSLNRHHELEHICRHIARNRICSNIIPATGPVSAGGDQGRDFESFRTYLNASSISNSSFIGLVSKGPLVFACTTTDEDNLIQKIKTDIATIMRHGENIIGIHYFCTEDLPVGKRHDLQKWSKTKYKKYLEIYDGQAISEFLSNRDIFWIAEQFLNIPAELYPSEPADSDAKWYRDLLDLWKNPECPPDNYADFTQIKSALRYATYTESVRNDISFWIGVIDSLSSHTPLEPLKRKATYEVAVASLRGFGSLIGYEQQLRGYFCNIPSLSQLSDIEDANVLLTFCIGAYRQNAVQLDKAELCTWENQIIDKIECELNATSDPSRRCTLLRDRAHWYIIPGLRDEDTPDINRAISCWLEIASNIEQAYLFPLENFSDELTQLLSFPLAINEHPDFHVVTKLIDEALEKRCGGFIAAEKCRDRALALYDKGEILQALNEIHIAKIKWFADETIKGLILATRFATKCYQELGLAFAAKYYALIGSYVALNPPDDSISRYAPAALIDVASSDYIQGAFCGFFDFSDIGLLAYRAFSREQDTQDIITEIERTVFHSTILRVISEHLAPDLLGFINERISKWEGLKEYFDNLVPLVEKEWKNVTFQELWHRLEDQMLGRPFSDVGTNRVVRFTALGVTWDFKWDNTYELTAASEEFLAVLQIILADFANIDLCLLRTTVDIEISENTDSKIIIEPLPSNELIRYRIMIPLEENREYEDNELFGIVTTMLADVSILPRDQFLNLLESALRQGLSGKAFFAQRYKKLHRHFIKRSDFDLSDRKSKSIPQIEQDFHPVVQHQLEWFCGPGLGYSEESANEALHNRYENALKPIRFTLLNLLTNSHFKKTVSELKAEGWLDWHVLNAVALVTVNYRANKQRYTTQNMEEFQNLVLNAMNQEEDVTLDPVPLSLFSKENLRLHLNFSMLSTLKALGFEIHQPTPDFNAISDFLGQRYNYWIDDIEHPDF
ncbi:hypothetical protein ACFLXA_01615 [Chloroflexota bacterium]